MGFKSDSQRRAMFAAMGNNKFSNGPRVVYVQPHVERVCPREIHAEKIRARVMEPQGPQLVQRKQSGFEILGQAGEKLAGGVVGVFPGSAGNGEGDGYESTNAVSGLWPDQNLEEMLVGITSATWPDSSEGHYYDDRHYYIDTDGPRHGELHGRNRFSYTPIYAVGDLGAMGVDAVGTAGATAVSFVPLATMLGIGYVGASMALKGKSKLEKQYYDSKRK